MNNEVSDADTSLEVLVVDIADDFAERVARGEKVSIEDYTSRHPQFADVIREVLTSLELIREYSRPSAELNIQPDAQSNSGIHGQLGDFRLLREIGRGGMGVVYEAEQVSLSRRVALKILPYAALVDHRNRQRFKNEAQAAARLHHGNIVPVHAVGCERGVHYYAMQYIEGEPLSNVIDQLRDFDPPEIARPSRASSRLLEDRHERRTKDADGSQSVIVPIDHSSTDDVGDGSAETITAAGAETRRSVHPHVVTPRSTRSDSYCRSIADLGVQIAGALDYAHEEGVIHRDIKPSNLILDEQGKVWVTDFGLAHIESGVTVTMTGDLIGTLRYMSPEQALAKRIVVDHRTDVYSLGVTLYELLTLQPAFPGEDRNELLRRIAFEEPVSIRKLNKSVSTELETILLKAMAKNPSERYDTASELADDLKRYLNDDPIRARRPSLPQRIARWSRRHHTLVKTAVVTAALFLTVLMVGLAVTNQMIAEERDAKETALEDSEQARGEEAKQRAAAQLAERRAREAAEQAKTERDRAEHNLRKAREAVDQMLTRAAGQLKGRPHMETIRRVLLDDALEFYKGFLEQKSDDPDIRYETALAQYRVGTIHNELGQFDSSVEALQAAVQLLEKLIREFPSVPEYRHTLANTHNVLRASFSDVAKSNPERALAHALAAFETQSKLAKEFPNRRRYRYDRAFYLSMLGMTYKARGIRQMDKAEESLRGAVQTWRSFEGEEIDPQYMKGMLAFSQFWLGSVMQDTRRYEDAERLYREALAMREQVIAEFPDNLSLLDNVAHNKAYLGELLLTLGKPDEAEVFYREAIEIRQRFVDDFPGIHDYWRRLLVLNTGLSNVFRAKGNLIEALTYQRKAVATKDYINAHFSEFGTRDIGWQNFNLGLLLYAVDDQQEAVDAFRRALKAFETHAEEFPKRLDALDPLGWFLITCPAEQFRDAEQAIGVINRHLQHLPNDGSAWANLGLARYRTGDSTGAIAALEKAMALRDGGTLLEWICLAMANARLGRVDEARKWYDQAVKAAGPQSLAGTEGGYLRAEADALLGITPAADPIKAD